ncbi:hypothetical protein FB567DRAFT_129202 [Paraphoma chrysanthemicola]|uniref:F-box domain-containing protein n=1 Tax=Paraphoma chrysanthemicola TaxID=798071 RepID=A0A8K0R0I4_9PLEO|nr:hypothetical protein FB567DRAFT_129202 [Paraphoma chrysanthemicola]
MDQLPQELHDQICGHLPLEDLRRVSYVSTTFRKSAEDQAEKHKSYSYEISNEKDRKEFVARYSGFRVRFLKNIYWEIFLPGPDIELPGSHENYQVCFESAEERHRRDTAFTEQIRTIFETLEAIERCAGHRNRGKFRLTIEVKDDFEDSNDYCMHRKHAQWRTFLLEPHSLPQVESIISLELVTKNSWAKLDYRIMIDLAGKLPNLEDLECRVGQDEWTPPYTEEEASQFLWEYDGPRRDTRHDFSKSVIPGVASNLQKAELDFLCRAAWEYADHVHQGKSMPNMVSPFSRDPFSSSLRILSYNLKELALRAQVDGSLFWPDDGSFPHWPNLENIYLMFHTVSPSGAWYFEEPQGEGRDSLGHEIDETHYPPNAQEDVMTDCDDIFESDKYFESWGDCQFRIYPNEAVLVPFLESFAKAAAQMPNLKQAVLWSPLRFSPDGDDELGPMLRYYEPPHQFYENHIAWGIAYETPGLPWGFSFSTKIEDRDCKARRIWWRVGEWRPSKQLHAAFQQIGCHRLGEDLQEDWSHEKYGSALVTLEYFELFTPEGRD